MSSRLFATDLDGTLLRNDKTISKEDLDTLKTLGEKGIVRVAATGRSMFKVHSVLADEVPVDYIVFSSGAGIYDWQNKKLLQSEKFDRHTTNSMCGHLVLENYNFFLFRPIPNNNLFYFYQGAGQCAEFENYIERHHGDYEKLNIENFPEEGGQFLVVIPNSEILFNKLEKEIYSNCKGIRIIRATSPINDNYLWLEIFPSTVSKGHGIEWLCEKLKIRREETVGVGNDYNDADMFRYVGQAYLVGNGVKSLKKLYKEVKATNQGSGVSEVAKRTILMQDNHF